MQKKNKQQKVSRGYRLKPETHKLIVRIQRITNTSAEEAISAACTKHYEELRALSSKNGKRN